MFEIYILMRSFLLCLFSCSVLRAPRSQKTISATCSACFHALFWKHWDHRKQFLQHVLIASWLGTESAESIQIFVIQNTVWWILYILNTSDRVVILFLLFFKLSSRKPFLSLCQNILSVLSVANSLPIIFYLLMTLWFVFAQIVMSLTAFARCIFDSRSMINICYEINDATFASLNRSDPVWKKRRLDCNREFKKSFKSKKDFDLLRTS